MSVFVIQGGASADSAPPASAAFVPAPFVPGPSFEAFMMYQEFMRMRQHGVTHQQYPQKPAIASLPPPSSSLDQSSLSWAELMKEFIPSPIPESHSPEKVSDK
jgi:hypothetical protein